MDSAIQQLNLPTCLKIYSPNRLFETFCDVTTVEEALAVKAPSMMTLTRTDGSSKKKVYGLLQLHLMLLSHNSKVKNGLTKMEIDLLASDILKTFYFLTFADIAVVMRRFYHGEYGKTYNQLTSGDIYQWFEQYANERCNTAEEMSRREDERRYGDGFRVPENFTLDMLGYTKDEETGAWRIDPDKSQKLAEERKRREDEQRDAELKKREEADELQRIRQEVAIKNILAKPEENRSQAEKDMLTIYRTQKKLAERRETHSDAL